MNNMNIALGEVWTFKLTSGEELVAKVVRVSDTQIVIDDPVSVAPGPQGLGLMPSLFTASQKSETILNTSCIAIFALTDEPVKAKYIEATTGLVVPGKKLIMG